LDQNEEEDVAPEDGSELEHQEPAAKRQKPQDSSADIGS